MVELEQAQEHGRAGHGVQARQRVLVHRELRERCAAELERPPVSPSPSCAAAGAASRVGPRTGASELLVVRAAAEGVGAYPGRLLQRRGRALHGAWWRLCGDWALSQAYLRYFTLTNRKRTKVETEPALRYATRHTARQGSASQSEGARAREL